MKLKKWNEPVEALLGQAPKKAGEIGIEIEAEGYNLPAAIEGTFWGVHHDGSLRAMPHKTVDGKFGAVTVPGYPYEYVLRKPIKRDEVGKALDELTEALKASKAEVRMSNRCSVHVHLNCQGMTMRQVFNQIIITTALESVLAEFCGDEREGNLFCLRVSDAEALLQQLRKAVKNGDYGCFYNDNLRYAFVNICALPKYNSIEYRGMRGTTDKALIQRWVNMLLSIKDAAKAYDSPSDIVRDFSMLGSFGWLQKVLGVNAWLFVGHKNEQRLFEGIRLAQDLAYAVEWGDKTRVNQVQQMDVEPYQPDDFDEDEDLDDDGEPLNPDEIERLMAQEVQAMVNPVPIQAAPRPRANVRLGELPVWGLGVPAGRPNNFIVDEQGDI